MNPTVTVYCMFHFIISSDEKMLLYSTWIGQSLPLWLNYRHRKNNFCLIFCSCQLTSYNQTKLIRGLKMIEKLYLFFTSLAQMISISVYLLRWVMICNMFTIHIIDVKATLWIFHWLLVLYLNCKSVMNFVPISFFVVFFTEKLKKLFFCHLTSRDLKKNVCSYTLYYIYLNKPDLNHMEWVCISDDGFVQTGNFLYLDSWLFLSFLYVCNE